MTKPGTARPSRVCSSATSANNRAKKENAAMKKYECPCGYVYDPELGDPDNGVAPGTPWEDVPEDWVCPVCGLGKDAFNEA